jgi:hypothetical protein
MLFVDCLARDAERLGDLRPASGIGQPGWVSVEVEGRFGGEVCGQAVW